MDGTLYILLDTRFFTGTVVALHGTLIDNSQYVGSNWLESSLCEVCKPEKLVENEHGMTISRV